MVGNLDLNSNGNYTWSRRIGGASSNYGRSIAIDRAGNVIVSGLINGNADLDGDESVAGILPEYVTGSTVFSCNDGFIVKFNPE